MSALRESDMTVLVLPCGRSAHLELGYATGAKKPTVVLLDDPMSEPELMYKACSAICVTVAEVVERVRSYSEPDPPGHPGND
jgi:nucleoside 2-deoxyribosyltransferase